MKVTWIAHVIVNLIYKNICPFKLSSWRQDGWWFKCSDTVNVYVHVCSEWVKHYSENE